jgi:hypothetical protein
MFTDEQVCPTDTFGSMIVNPDGSAPGLVETSMNNGAWNVLDYAQLWLPRSQRGSNVTKPALSGRWAHRRRIDQTEYVLDFVVGGVIDQYGTPHANRYEGLRENLAWLAENVVDPPPTGATRTVYFLSPEAVTLTAEVQFLSIESAQRLDDVIVGTLHLLIPLGGFVEIPS